MFGHLHLHTMYSTLDGMGKIDEIFQRAKELGLKIAEFPADWEKFGKKAGYLRNTEMGKYATHAIIFSNSEDKGSNMMINIMKYFKKPCRHINI